METQAKISLCVFSKNRALQLDAFLKSLVNAPYVDQVRVLYTTDNGNFETGYEILKGEYPHIQFIRECGFQDFNDKVIEVVDTSHEYFTWATDDSIFYRQVDLTQEKLDWVFKENTALALNLRMGLNIKWQNHWKSDRSDEIQVEKTFDDIVIWNADNYSVNTDVGRVWQNDASIMPRDLYLSRLRCEDGWKVNKSRSLDGLASCGRIFQPCQMAAFRESVYLNIPVTLIHALDDGRVYADNWGHYVRYDLNNLNELFLLGGRIDWEAIDSSNLDCGRREVKYEFLPKGMFH
jgi:hypothetical protein